MPKAASFRVQRNTCQSTYRRINDVVLKARDVFLLEADEAELARVGAETSESRGIPIGNVRAMMLYAADASFAWCTADVKVLTAGAARTNSILRQMERMTFSRSDLLDCTEATQEATAKALAEAGSLLEEAKSLAATASALVERVKSRAEALGQRVGVKPVVIGSDAADGAVTPLPPASGYVPGPDAESAAPAKASAGNSGGMAAAAALTGALPPLVASKRGAGRGNRAQGGTGGGWPRLRNPAAASAGNCAASRLPSSSSSRQAPDWLRDLVAVCQEVIAIKPSCARDPFAAAHGGPVADRAPGAPARGRPTAAARSRGAPGSGGLRAAAMKRAASVAATGGVMRPRAAGSITVSTESDPVASSGAGVDVRSSTPSGRRSIPPALHLHLHSSQEFVDAAAGRMPSPAVVDASTEEREGDGSTGASCASSLSLLSEGPPRRHEGPVGRSTPRADTSLATKDLLAVVHACWAGSGPRPLSTRVVSITRTFGSSAAMACGGLGDWLGRNRDLGGSAGLTDIKQAAKTAVRAITPPISRT